MSPRALSITTHWFRKRYSSLLGRCHSKESMGVETRYVCQIIPALPQELLWHVCNQKLLAVY